MSGVFGPILYLGMRHELSLWCLNSTGIAMNRAIVHLTEPVGIVKKYIWETFFSDVFGVNSPSTGFFVVGFLCSMSNLNSEHSHRRHEPTIFVLILPSSFQGQPDPPKKDLT